MGSDRAKSFSRVAYRNSTTHEEGFSSIILAILKK